MYLACVRDPDGNKLCAICRAWYRRVAGRRQRVSDVRRTIPTRTANNTALAAVEWAP